MGVFSFVITKRSQTNLVYQKDRGFRIGPRAKVSQNNHLQNSWFKTNRDRDRQIYSQIQ